MKLPPRGPINFRAQNSSLIDCAADRSEHFIRRHRNWRKGRKMKDYWPWGIVPKKALKTDCESSKMIKANGTVIKEMSQFSCDYDADQICWGQYNNGRSEINDKLAFRSRIFPMILNFSSGSEKRDQPLECLWECRGPREASPDPPGHSDLHLRPRIPLIYQHNCRVVVAVAYGTADGLVDRL